MNWRKELPDRPGWWWSGDFYDGMWKRSIEYIYRYTGTGGLKVDDLAERLSAQHLTPEEHGGWWAGPIEPPPPPEPETKP